ncbi:hypothetical protein LR48_Vigan04g110800 [Vigna angularis]|uniref:Uncharacterized protein n=1 Tax=Phaseolus angularis TaxID=3914 RepID=A0A0L9UD95_PHAAN|nr:hypothetical protein LR48_Vigan04g110800 [Vigna angularis]
MAFLAFSKFISFAALLAILLLLISFDLGAAAQPDIKPEPRHKTTPFYLVRICFGCRTDAITPYCTSEMRSLVVWRHNFAQRRARKAATTRGNTPFFLFDSPSSSLAILSETTRVSSSQTNGSSLLLLLPAPGSHAPWYLRSAPHHLISTPKHLRSALKHLISASRRGLLTSSTTSSTTSAVLPQTKSSLSRAPHSSSRLHSKPLTRSSCLSSFPPPLAAADCPPST